MSEPSAEHSVTDEGLRHRSAPTCLNCGKSNLGEFCAGCGQKRIHAGDLGLAHVWHHIVHELVHLDGKIFTSLKLMFTRPGRLTLDFLEGRRARHVHPIRLFIVFSSIFFFFAPLDVTKNNRGLNVRLNTEALEQVDRHAVAKGMTRNEVLENLHDRLRPIQKAVVLVSLLLNGFWLWALFRARWHYLGEHMVTALHLGSFQLVVLTVTGWLDFRPVGSWITVDPLPLLVGLLYFLLAARVIYGGSWLELFLKWFVQAAATILIVTFAGGTFAIMAVKSYLSSL
jgi:hypothetical protein